MKSPFQYGTLVDKESFVNRVEERKQLKELLGSGINVMLISPRRWGKSSLVKVAMDELTQEDKHIRVCFIDAFSIKTEAEFYRIFAREVISCAASTLEKRLEDVKQFLKAVSPSITLKSDSARTPPTMRSARVRRRPPPASPATSPPRRGSRSGRPSARGWRCAPDPRQWPSSGASRPCSIRSRSCSRR